MTSKRSRAAGRPRPLKKTIHNSAAEPEIKSGHPDDRVAADIASGPTPRAAVWLSAKAAAARADCSVRTIKRWIDAGYLKASRTPSFKGMGHLRIRVGDLESLLAGGALG